MVKVKTIMKFKDMEANVERLIGEEFECEEERAKYLKENNAIEILEEPKKAVKEDKPKVIEFAKNEFEKFKETKKKNKK